MQTLIQRTIARAGRGSQPGTTGRMRQLATVRWMLATEDGRFVSIDDRAAVSLIHEPGQAAVYDGRDNEDLKRRFMEALLKVPLTVVILDGCDGPALDSPSANHA